MRTRVTVVGILGVALAFAATAAAQDTTRTDTTRRTMRTRPATSTERIRLTKEAAGEVVSRVDTVTVYRTDTMTVYRTDTLTNTTTRVDTVQVAMPIAPIRHIGGMYFGLAGGASFPAADQNNVNKPGPRVDGILGFDPINFPLGLRLDAGYSTHTLHDFYANQNLVPGGAKFWDVSGDLKLRAPSLSPFGFHFQMYGLGGGTFNYWKNLIQIAPNGVVYASGNTYSANPNGTYTFTGTTTGTTNTGAYGTTTTTTGTVPNYSGTWYHNWGWNVGGGAQLGWGRVNLFAEGRFQRFHDRVNVANAPLIIGLNWY